MRYASWFGLAALVVGGCGEAGMMRDAAPATSEVAVDDSGSMNGVGGEVGNITLQQGTTETSQFDEENGAGRGPGEYDAQNRPVEVAQADAASKSTPDKPATAETPPKPGDVAKPDGAAKPNAAAKPKDRPAPAAPTQRRIIYTATLHLVVTSVDEAGRQIVGLLKQHDGYIADSEIGSPRGRTRTGRWVLRIPVARYDAFLEALGPVGIPENVQQKAQDVTREFVDLTARISNQKRLEDRLKTLLEQRAGELKDAIEVERELARVRSDIESMEGRLRYLQNQVSFSTVTIHVREELNYVPPQAPSFGGRISNVWANSLRSLRAFGQGTVLFAVAVAPWLPLIALAIWLVRTLFNRLNRRRSA